jgi:very-short-patch-repair endonuclease
MGRKLTNNDVIERIKEIHGNKYNLSKVSYVNSRTKIEVICPKHGSFFTSSEQLFRGQGCSQCGLISQGEKNRLPQNEFLIKSNQVHSGSYDYTKSNYQVSKKKITITCRIHGDFEQTPSSHLNGSGCPKCGLVSSLGKRKLSLNEFISRSIKIHKKKYDYSKVVYHNITKKVNIRCPEHGFFLQQPQFHINGSGCPKCSIIEQHAKQKKTTKEVIRDSILTHGDLYDYSKLKVIDTKTEVIIICKKHGEFLQTPNNHQRGNGCPNCNSSKGEEKIKKILTNNNIKFQQQYRFKGLQSIRSLKCDFYLPKHKIVIEFNGRQHYEPVRAFGGKIAFIESQERDKIKRLFLKENNIRLLEIHYEAINLEELILNFIT